MRWRSLFDRHRVVTGERNVIDPRLLGLPLAAPWRRGAALLLDLVLSVVVVLPWTALCGIGAAVLHAPALVRLVMEAREGEPVTADLERDLRFELAAMIAGRRPDMLPPGAVAALAAGDREEVARLLDGDSVNIQGGSTAPSHYDRATGTLHVRGDVIYGRLAPLFGVFSAVLAYFALGTWWGKGATPGKRLLGLRVVRLDGRPLTLWDTFGRAGGYGASLSTFGLGFLEALWEPNRQALHDRISSTVVLPRAALD